MKSPLPNIKFIETFFSKLRQNQIEYCIIRNAEEVQQGDAHDVDLTVDENQLIKTHELLSSIANELGWTPHLITGRQQDKVNIKCYNYFYINDSEKKIYIVHIDIFPVYSWRGYEILPNSLLLKNINKDTIYHKLAPETEAVCNLFVRLLYNGKIKDKYKPKVLTTFQTNKEKVINIMCEFLTQELADWIYNNTVHKKWDIIEQKRSKIIHCIKKLCKRDFFNYLRYLASKALHRTGAIIVFQGTDGSGKTTIINRIESVLGNTFSNNTLNYYHWRPGFIRAEKKLTADGNVVDASQPHSLAPHGKIYSLIKLLFYTCDYILGYWFKVYRQAAQGHLVVFDRYYYDFYMDKARYRLNIGNWIIRLLHLFIPKPDITFVLLGDAEKIHARKNELPLEEVQRQIDLLRANKRLFASPVVVDVCRSIPEVVYTVSSNILKKLSGQKLG